MRRMSLSLPFFFFLFVTLLNLHLPIDAQEEGWQSIKKPDVRIQARFERFVEKEREIALSVSVYIPEGAYIYKDKTIFSVKDENLEVTKIEYPEPERYRHPILGMETDVYRQEKVFKCRLRWLKEGQPFPRKIPLEISYQACIKNICFFPETVLMEIEVPESTESTSKSKGGFSINIEEASGKGPLILLFITFLAGVLASFTPCIYPIIPVTISVIGARSAGSRWKGFLVSMVYVAGISVTYTLLGLFAAFTGSIFGSILQKPIVSCIVALIFFVMGLSMLGLFEIALPSSIVTKITPKKGKGKGGGLLFPLVAGLVAGVVVSPCVGPLIISLLTYIAKEGSLIKGALLMFIFSCGMGLLLLVIGTFTGILTSLPKSGSWMVTIRNIFGFILIGVSLYFLRSVIPSYLLHFVTGIFIVTIGYYIIEYEVISTAGIVIKRSLGTLIIISGALLFVHSLPSMGLFKSPHVGAEIGAAGRKGVTGVKWLHDETNALELSKMEGKPLMIDFWANWCIPCLKLDSSTFQDKRVVKTINELFVPLKVDATHENDEVRRLLKKYGVMGLPTILFVQPSGRIVEEPIITGYIEPDDLLAMLERILSFTR